MPNSWLAMFFTLILLSSIFAIPFTFAQNAIPFNPPLKQISNGLSPENVVCSNDFVRFEKLSDKSIVCVKSSTADVLSKRNWGILLVQEIKKEAVLAKINEYAKQHHTCCILNDPSYIHYVFLRHNDTNAPNFIVYHSDENSKSMEDEWLVISFIQSNKTATNTNNSEYFSNDTDSKYAWAFYTFYPIWTIMIFVDPITGEIIGYYSAGCTICT